MVKWPFKIFKWPPTGESSWVTLNHLVCMTTRKKNQIQSINCCYWWWVRAIESLLLTLSAMCLKASFEMANIFLDFAFKMLQGKLLYAVKKNLKTTKSIRRQIEYWRKHRRWNKWNHKSSGISFLLFTCVRKAWGHGILRLSRGNPRRSPLWESAPMATGKSPHLVPSRERYNISHLYGLLGKFFQIHRLKSAKPGKIFKLVLSEGCSVDIQPFRSYI